MFTFKLVLEDGTPADPPTFTAAVPNWKAGDVVPLGAGRSLRVVEVRDDAQIEARDIPGVGLVVARPPVSVRSRYGSRGERLCG